MNNTLRVIDIVDGTSVDGTGLRTSIYFAGCKHQCPGCHNPQTWAFDAGRDMTIDELMNVIEYNRFNVTFSGGDPLYQAPALLKLAERIKASDKTIWCYTGFTYEQLCAMPEYADLLKLIDVLVDGPFIEAQRNPYLKFRGSDNQRLIDVAQSTADNVVTIE
jgi:anaerobic ribonucleoside-triphosphate reductase activating protein